MIGPTKLCPEGIGLTFFDLDDTVLVDGTYITPRMLDTINLARERGCMACVSTGRAFHLVPESMRKPQYMDYLLCANGARIYDTFGGLLYERSMTREQVLAAMDALEPLKPSWNGFIDDHAYFEFLGLSYMLTGRREALTLGTQRQALHTGMGQHLRELALNARKGLRFAQRVLERDDDKSMVRHIRPFVEQSQQGIAKLGCSLPSRKACERAMAILDHLGFFEVARMSWTELEVTAKGVTKGTAARWLMDYLHVDPACAVAFGDSENDAPLAEACGTFVAVANADSRVREIADDVCESIYDDGVARWLERTMAEADGAQHE